MENSEATHQRKQPKMRYKKPKIVMKWQRYWLVILLRYLMMLRQQWQEKKQRGQIGNEGIQQKEFEV